MIKWIVILLTGLVVLGFYGIDVRKAIDAPTTQSNLEYVKRATILFWNKYLERPASYVWNDGFMQFLWNPIKNSLIDRLNGRQLKEMDLKSLEKVL